MTKENLDLKFEDYKYIRPDLEKLTADIRALTERLVNAKTVDEAIETYNELNEVISDADSMVSLAHIKNSIDTKDEFYDKEMQFIQENFPKVEEVSVEYIREFVNSKFRKGLEEKFGVYLFQKYENYLLTFNPSIIEDLVEEAKVVMEYQKLLSSCSKEWNGEQLNLTQLSKYSQDKDADVRRKATNLISEVYEEQTEKLDEIYDKIVKIRDRMAKKLGYKNFVELGYKKMGRVDY
ncbi:MAG: M3 family oligoendopeptidase, partial [Fusobacterium periodonticum]|nr:M3 family oligoendopeptidase [Fusobacterium periodonticum]